MEHNGFEYVDLGLPSGTMWATCNVGANDPFGSGLYFQWGSTIGFNAIDASNKINLLSNRHPLIINSDTYSKYNTKDKKTILELVDDAAHVNMGGKWRLPTITDVKELLNSEYTKLIVPEANKRQVWEIVSKINNNRLLLPSYGYISRTTLEGINSLMELLTSNSFERNIYECYHMYSELSELNGKIRIISFNKQDFTQARGVFKE